MYMYTVFGCTPLWVQLLIEWRSQLARSTPENISVKLGENFDVVYVQLSWKHPLQAWCLT